MFVQTNLITNDQNVVQAQHTDPNLINPWGFSFSTTSPLWVSNQGTGVATVYALKGASSSATLLTAPIPNLGSAPPSVANGPTGQVSTGAPGVSTLATDFQVNGTKAAFIFANLDGSISAWRGGLPNNTAIIQASVAGASFTGLAIGNATGGAARIYAADQNSGNVYVFNGSWQNIGTFTDPNGLPSGFTAFNVQNINGNLFVTYANPNNPLGGIVDEFTTDGAFVGRLITDPTGTRLDSPWGLALAPAGWGQFGGDLLIGNNGGDGTINAYTLGGVWQGQIQLTTGQLFSEQQLWGLTFGSGSASGGARDVLYFAAGFDAAADEGLVGAIAPAAPEPSSAILALSAVSLLAGGWTYKNARRRLNSRQGRGGERTREPVRKRVESGYAWRRRRGGARGGRPG
jgi:uncharacterized protein (TIGR03118 family)